MKSNLLLTPIWKTRMCIALAMFLCLFSTQHVLAQCTNTVQFLTRTIDPNGNIVQISNCSLAGDFNPILGAVSGQTLNFTSSTATDLITIRSGTSSGPVLAFGTTPLSFSNTFNGTVFAHWNTPGCGTQGSCRTTTVQCTNCPIAPDPCEAPIETIACATFTTTTVEGAGTGWSPGSCGFTTPGAEKVYSFTAAVTGVHTLQVIFTDGNGVVDYFFKDAADGCSPTGWTCIGDFFQPGSVTFGPLTAGTTYFILLDAETAASVMHTFKINCPAPDPCDVPNETIACTTPTTTTLDGDGAAGWSIGSCGFPTPGAEKVYSFTATSSGIHTLLVTATTLFKFVDYSFKDAAGGCSPTGWTCIRDFQLPGSIDFGPLTAGTTYFILLDAEGIEPRAQTFQIICPAPDPCTTPIEAIACATPTTTTLEGFGPAEWILGTCGLLTPGSERNYSFTAAVNGTHTLQVTATSNNVNVHYSFKDAADGCSTTGWTCIADIGSPTSIQFGPLTAGTTYFILLDAQTTPSVVHTFQIYCPAAPPNDNCANAEPITCGQTISGSNIDAEAEPGVFEACGVTETTAGVWYSFTGDGTNVTLNTCTGASFDTKISVFSGTCAAPDCVGGNDDFCNQQSELTFTSISGTPYLVLVHGVGGATGSFDLSMTCSAPPVVFNCSSPFTFTSSGCFDQAATDAFFNTFLESVTASGGCDGVLTNDNTGPPPICVGSVTNVTFTYTSTCEPFITTCTKSFRLIPPPPPTVECPADFVAGPCQTQLAINQQYTAWFFSFFASGGCNGVSSPSDLNPPSACGGASTKTITYTTTTCAPFISTCSATFTVLPAPPVVLTCPPDLTVGACQTQAQVNAQYADWLASASASGGCGGVLTNNSSITPLSACGSFRTVTFTYTTTCAPFTTTCSASFRVASPPNAVLTCPPNLTVGPCLTQAQLNAQYADWLASAAASGGCDGVLTNDSPGAPSICSVTGTVRTVTFTYTNTCSSNRTCTATFTVQPYPDFAVPANGATTVACPSNIIQPVPPVVLDACGKTLTPVGPVITTQPDPVTCEGTRTFTWTFTDCAGHTQPWSHVVTVERQPLTIATPTGSATVACPDDTDVVPTPPVVLSNCGEVLTPVLSASPKNACEGDRAYTFRFTDCEGNSADWVFIYHVEYLDFTVPASVITEVECPSQATAPVPPTIVDNCGKLLTPVASTTSTDNAQGCEGSRTFSFTYTDCEGNAHTWSQTFQFQYSADFFPFTDQEDFVGCLLYAQPPVPPTLYDDCGNEIKVTGPVIEEDITAEGCSGTRKFTFTYTNCGGQSHDWVFTTHAADTEPPVGNCTANSVDVTDLSCIGDVPCPEDFNFEDKIAELIAAGDFYDVCSGDDITVELDSWTALWKCADLNLDGEFTFGRTFYFRIADACGNEYPSLCGVTYSGVCQPIETFPQTNWGIAGGLPSSNVAVATDLEVIQTLLGQGPLKVGGTNRSLTVDQAQCVVDLLPGANALGTLRNCHQVNCSGGCNPMGIGGMKNGLSANAIALELNLRFNVHFNGLAIANLHSQRLNCITINPNIVDCPDNGGAGDCELRVFESDGTVHVFPYTIGGLQNLVNLYLNGGLSLSIGQSAQYAAALNSAITAVNDFWHDGGIAPATACNPAAGASAVEIVDNRILPTGKLNTEETIGFSLAPNPAGHEVRFTLTELPEAQDVTFEIYNQLGQLLLRKEFGKVASASEPIDLSGIGNGLYIVSVKAGGARFEQKLVVGKD